MDLNIRFAEDKDKDEIIYLLNDSFSDIQRTSQQRGEGYWNWKFRDNPFGKAILTVAEINNRIIAINNLWPWEFNIRGSVLKALQPCDSVVHKDFRGKGIFKMMRIHGLEIARAQDFKFMFNFPNENSLLANLSLGWHFQGKIAWWVKVLKPVKVLQGILSPGKTEPVIIDKKYYIDLNAVNHIAQKNISYDGFLKINRTPGFHEWRYIKHPYRSYGMVLYDQGNKATAAIFTINQNGKNREMVIVDIIGSTDNAVPVLKMAADAGKKMDAGFVAVMNNLGFKTHELWKLGFLKRKYKNMVVLPLDLSLESIVKSYSSWSLMASMHDSV